MYGDAPFSRKIAHFSALCISLQGYPNDNPFFCDVESVGGAFQIIENGGGAAVNDYSDRCVIGADRADIAPVARVYIELGAVEYAGGDRLAFV